VTTENDSWGVLLLAHGAPDRLEDIPEFLLNVRGGRPLPEPAIEEIKRRYAMIGGGSPLLKVTTRQAEGLAKLMRRPVFVGMRNWKPFIPEAITKIAASGLKQVFVLCLAPHNSRTSTGLYKKHLTEAVENAASTLAWDFVESWHDHSKLIEAFHQRISTARTRIEAATGKSVSVIFTAHSVPEKTIASGDPYEQQVRETAKLTARAMGLAEYRVAFQSQGMTSEPWIGPTVESQIDELAAAGCGNVLLAPIGFVSDHVEILYDIDVVFREYGRKRGVHVARSDSLNDSPMFIQALASIVSARAAAASQGAMR
jgi:protoporphyrin/coproporphyrin ferrochelatase